MMSFIADLDQDSFIFLSFISKIVQGLGTVGIETCFFSIFFNEYREYVGIIFGMQLILFEYSNALSGRFSKFFYAVEGFNFICYMYIIIFLMFFALLFIIFPKDHKYQLSSTPATWVNIFSVGVIYI